jgi:hypothetical protein
LQLGNGSLSCLALAGKTNDPALDAL